jgi:hypothetical protein
MRRERPKAGSAATVDSKPSAMQLYVLYMSYSRMVPLPWSENAPSSRPAVEQQLPSSWWSGLSWSKCKQGDIMQAIRDSCCHVRRACKRTEQGCKHGDERHSCLLTGLPFVKNAFQIQTFLVACSRDWSKQTIPQLGTRARQGLCICACGFRSRQKSPRWRFFFLASR